MDEGDPCSRAATWILALGTSISLIALVLCYRAWQILAAARARFGDTIEGRARDAARLTDPGERGALPPPPAGPAPPSGSASAP